MTAIIWLFFLVVNVAALYWYLQNRDAVGAFDRTISWFAMKDESAPAEKQDDHNTWRSDA